MAFRINKYFKRKMLLLEATIAMVFVVSLTLFFLNLPDVDQEIRMLRLKVTLIRSKIERFYKNKDRYPDSLKELEEYIEITTESEDNIISFKEHFSNIEGVATESKILNGEGGWYYDKTNGEIKLNLTQPIKHYKPNYRGKYRNEIPSDW